MNPSSPLGQSAKTFEERIDPATKRISDLSTLPMPAITR